MAPEKTESETESDSDRDIATRAPLFKKAKRHRKVPWSDAEKDYIIMKRQYYMAKTGGPRWKSVAHEGIKEGILDPCRDGNKVKSYFGLLVRTLGLC